MKDGNWIEIPGGGLNINPDDIITITAQGNRFQANGNKVMILDGHPSGKVYLKLQGGQKLLDFRIEPIQ